jgi:UDP-glucose:glycoprotein glucosyltransferase
MDTVKMAFERFEKDMTFEELLESPESNAVIDKIAHYLDRVGDTSEAGSIFVNGKYAPFSPQWAHMLQSTLGEQVNFLQEAIHSDYSFDADSISTYFYDLPTTSLRRNAVIVPENEFEVKTFNLADLFNDDAFVLNQDFLYPPDESAHTPLTVWVIGDLDSEDGIGLVRNAVEHLMTDSASSRVGFIHVPGSNEAPKGKGYRLSTLIYQLLEERALSEMNPAEFLAILDEIDTKGNLVDVGEITADSENESSAGDVPLNSFTYSGWTAGDVANAPKFWHIGSIAAERLKLKSSKPHILVNGRVSLLVL